MRVQSIVGPVLTVGIVMSQPRCWARVSALHGETLYRCQKTEGHQGNHENSSGHNGHTLIWGVREGETEERAWFESNDV